MKKIFFINKEFISLYILYIYINFFYFIFSFDVSSLKVNYFRINKQLYYVNGINNENNDLFLEFWGESNNIRYIIGINSTTGEEINYRNEKIVQIETNLNLIYHESIIITKNNENNIFTANPYYFEFININNGTYKVKITGDLFDFEVLKNSGIQNSIIKLQNKNYLLSLIIYKSTWGYKHHNHFLINFNFNSSDIYASFNIIKMVDINIDYLNSTSCFQTVNSYIQCSYNRLLSLNDVFAIGIFNLDLQEKNYQDISSSIEESSFTKIFHINNNIGGYIYFDGDTNLPNIKIKNLNENEFILENVFDFESIILNENGKYTSSNSFNSRLFYSDVIKINDTRFVVLLTMNDLLNILICVFDLYNDNKSLRLRYFELELGKINIQIGVNIRGIRFGNFFGIMFYNSNNEYPGYSLFNFPNIINEIDYFNNTKIQIQLFIDSITYSFSFPEIILTNNIFGDEIESLKILNFTDTSLSGVKINSSKSHSELNINEELDIEDQLIFQPSEKGAIPDKYILYFSTIIKEPNNNITKSFSNLTLYFGEEDDDYEPKKYNGNVFRLYYIIECHEKCKTCSKLGSESNYYCVKCVEEYPYIINNGEKCDDKCDNYIFVKDDDKYCIEKCDDEQFIYIENENEKYCIENCNESQFKYFLNENEKYCLSNCIFRNNELYLDEENKICYNSCSENNYGKKYSYENKCVSTCPIEYIPNLNNICIKIQENNQTTLVDSSLVDDDKLETDGKTSIIINIETNIESSIIEKGDISIDSSLIDNIETNIKSSEIVHINTSDITDILTEINSTFIEVMHSISVVEYSSEIEATEIDNTQLVINNDINSIIENYIKNGKDSELEVKLINNDTIISFYSTQSDLDTLIDLNPNLTYVNLKDCKNLLISENKLEEKSELLILGIETKNNEEDSITNIFSYEIYTTTGEKITDLSVCQNSNIEISSPVTNLDTINYNEALILFEQGYDIYNLSSDFYYDYCLSAYINGSDLTLSIRQQEIYPNISLCQDDCTYNGFDLENKRVNCICNSNSEKNNNNENFKEEAEQNFFIYIIDMINYQIFTCFDNIFNIKNYFYNFGFYIGFCLVLVILVSMLVFLFYGKKNIKLEYLHKEPNMKKIKEIEENFNKNFETKNIIPDKETKFKRIRKASTNVKTLRKKKYFTIHGLVSNPIKNKKSKKKLKFKKRKPKTSVDINLKISGEDIDSKQKYILDISNDNYKRYILSNRVIINTSSTEKKNLENDEYNELPYFEAFENDKRNAIKTFLSYFYLKLKTIQILFYKKEFTHMSLTLSFYFFEILLDLTINSLLFSDDVISQKYFNNGELLFITTNMLSISSNIISYIILLFTEKLINYNLILEEINKQIKCTKDYYKIYIKLICCFNLKISIFYFIILLLGIFCTYYLFIFCAIFKQIQKNLFINYIIGSLWSLGFTVFICLFVTITRKIAIKYKIKRLYIISKYIDDKF